MFKIGDFETEDYGCNLDYDNASITIYNWNKSVEDLINLFKNNNCAFEIDGIIYNEYRDIISGSINALDNSYTIYLNGSKSTSDILTEIFGNNLSYQEVKSKRVEIEEIAMSLDNTCAMAHVWMFPEYQKDKFYNVNDKIRYGGNIYKCTIEHFAPEALDDAYWINLAEES